MPPKPVAIKTAEENDTKRSIIVVPSRVVTRPDEYEGQGEEIEIAAQITIPPEGGWGWMVVFASFANIFLLDGVAFTFGSMLQNMSEELGVSESLIALTNSTAVALYFIAGPITSALINRFGFRACAMSGAVIDTFALIISYFSKNYTAICIFYGGVAGIGYCLIYMASALVVGFYFERLRSLAISITTAGSSLGVMVMFPFNAYIVNLAGWRVLTLLHSALFGIIFFLSMTFKPVLSLTVMKTTDDPTKTVTFLPSLAAVRTTPSKSAAETLMPTATEKLFKAVSNINFPTAAAVLDDRLATASSLPGPSGATVSKITIRAHSPDIGVTQEQLKQVKSIISRSSVQDKKNNIDIIAVDLKTRKNQKWWKKLCHWESHVPEARPMYRDDAFYSGKIEHLPVYQKSVLDTSDEQKTGMEYQLAVSRAVTTGELEEKRGIFTTAARRVLATMMDPSLLKRFSFVLISISGFLTYLGYLVPFVYLPDRNAHAGISAEYCTWFVSAIGFANGIGRLVLGAVAVRVNPFNLFTWSIIIAGIATMLCSLSFNVYYQFVYCCVFGFFIASIACIRSMVIVELYGLEKLTNATGIMLLFQGIASLISTPIAGALKTRFGYNVVFYISGFFITLSGIVLLPIKRLSRREISSNENSITMTDADSNQDNLIKSDTIIKPEVNQTHDTDFELDRTRPLSKISPRRNR